MSDEPGKNGGASDADDADGGGNGAKGKGKGRSTDGDFGFEGGTMMVTGYVSYAGGAAFGLVRAEPQTGDLPSPEAASSRSYLRRGLPAIYAENDFGMRFVGALERVLDPIVATLDALPAHFDPELAPVDVLGLMTAWLGLQYDESLTTDELRQLVAQASELGRRRGTLAGLEMALKLNFPGVPLRIEDHGTITWSTDPDAPPPSPEARTSFVVYCDEPVPEARQWAIAQIIEDLKPVHVSYRLRVKVSKKKPKERA